MKLVTSPNDLIKTIFSIASEKGFTDRDLAKESNISAVGLSKAKGRGDMRLSTVIALLDTLRMDIVIKPRDETRQDALELLHQGKLK